MTNLLNSSCPLHRQAVAPIFSLLIPRYQFSAADKKGPPVSRDPEALKAKYSDPLVFTGSIRVRTGYEILRISYHLQQNLNRITVPFLVLHGTADTVTDPVASKILHQKASSSDKTIKLYDGFLHDLLFEPEKEEIISHIIEWLSSRLEAEQWTPRKIEVDLFETLKGFPIHIFLVKFSMWRRQKGKRAILYVFIPSYLLKKPKIFGQFRKTCSIMFFIRRYQFLDEIWSLYIANSAEAEVLCFGSFYFADQWLFDWKCQSNILTKVKWFMMNFYLQ